MSARYDGTARAAVTIEGKDANYLRTQLNKRIGARDLSNIKISVVNNVAYLEKLQTYYFFLFQRVKARAISALVMNYKSLVILIKKVMSLKNVCTYMET